MGQCELMFMYDKFFGEYNLTVAQVLLTGDVIANEHNRKNTENTFMELIGMGIIPVVNENDTVAVDELEGARIGDNDTLSAIVARIVGADLLVILTDIDGLYDKNPAAYPDAKRIPFVPQRHGRNPRACGRKRLQPRHRRHEHQGAGGGLRQRSGHHLLRHERRGPGKALHPF